MTGHSASGTDQLDSFETALLAELRREVTEHPAPPAPARRPRRRVRLAAVGATGVAASVVAVFGLGSTGGSPAYAVAENGDGDVIVTVHRLDDAAGLEAALRDKGIDADVSYDPDGTTAFGVAPDGEMLRDDELPPPAEGGPESGVQQKGGGDVKPGFGSSGTDSAGALPDDFCHTGSDPASLTKRGDDWVLRIPAGSPLMDRHVEIGTDAQGGLAVFYAGDGPGSFCGLVSMNAPQS